MHCVIVMFSYCFLKFLSLSLSLLELMGGSICCVCVCCVILMSCTIISVCPALVAPCLCTLTQECIMFHIIYGMMRMCVCVMSTDVNTCLSSPLSLFGCICSVSGVVWLTSHGCHNFHNIASPYYCVLILAHSVPFPGPAGVCHP